MKKLLSIVVLSSLCLSLFSGCNKGSDVSKSTSTSASIETKSSTEETKTTPVVEDVKISWLHHYGEEGSRKWVDFATQKFTEKYPNITFNIQGLSFDSYVSTLQTKIASGDAPDIFDLSGQDFIKYDQNNYLTDLKGQPFLENINQAGIDGASFNGKVLGLTMGGFGWGIHYNKEVFKKAGITKLPETYSEFLAICKSIKDIGVAPIAQGYKESWTISGEIQCDYVPSLYKLYPTATMDLMERKVRFSDSKEWRDEFTRLAERYVYGVKDPFGTDWNGACEMVASGKAAMILNGTWTIDAIKSKNPDVEVGVFAMPYSENAADTVLPISSNSGLVIFKGSKNTNQCLDFFSHLTTNEIAVENMKLTKSLSTVKGLDVSFDPSLSDVMSYESKGKLFSMSSMDHNFANEYRVPFENILSKFLLSKDKNVDALVKELDKEFDRIKNSK